MKEVGWIDEVPGSARGVQRLFPRSTVKAHGKPAQGYTRVGLRANGNAPAV